ncbi:3' terminal RNA ribose 2'-O-methyltransferase Hen1 [Candidatus Tisiphia endosymbiont of Nemotelus uliginosus]|uniref:3' terminal RNA ribose 2'-O-methyltransferase Hen1 n=1 Tax=Candidatus Tisiphia endosymbiont of Nemotelus uliginosus TaxID=3077926 RepID=UPI0035C90281
MLLTITTTYNPATDIGYLLHKNPHNLHTIKLSFGDVHVFYPEVTVERCTAALILDVDPVALVRNKTFTSKGFALEQYVNDRPYVSSSFMSVALNKGFGTLFSGKSKQRQELVDQPMPLEIKLFMLPCRGDEKLLHSLFKPLGYEVEVIRHILDNKFPEWGYSPYFTVILKRTCPLREFLIHLYVLIPVLDNDKHYWIGDDEVKKLLKFGEGWLAVHPEKDLIVRRYLKNLKSLANEALECLSEGQVTEEINESGEVITTQEESLENKINLNQQRIEWVIAKLKAHNVKRVIDLGCGEGKLLQHLLSDNSFEQIVGTDVSSRVLRIASEYLDIERLPSFQRKRISLMQTALTYRDKRLAGYDAATLLEVIEHMDLPRLDAFKRVVFEFAKPSIVIITTPNIEYNVLFENLTVGQFRHPDHRFEWTRQEFQHWANEIAQQFGYNVTFDNIGNEHDTLGAPTQVGVFVKND